MYVAMAVPGITFRLAFASVDRAETYCCAIDPDLRAGLRLAAAARLCEHLGLTSKQVSNQLAPTRFQQRRLTLLLEILDRLDTERKPPATVRAVATELVYRNMGHQSAAAWKASSQRRQTQRLIAEARAMMLGGYRALLMGNILKNGE